MKGNKWSISISNEFATVLLEVDLKANGERLMVKSIKNNTTLFIDPLELDFITSLSQEQFTSVLESIIRQITTN